MCPRSHFWVFTKLQSVYIIMINCASFFQGPTGVTGPKGARGAQGAPVSKTFILSNKESITPTADTDHSHNVT